MNDHSTHMPGRFRHRIAPLGIALAAAFAQAQTPPDAGSQFSGDQRLQQRLPDRIPQTDRAETVRPALRDAGGERVVVRRIRFSGAADLLPAAELQAVVADALGKPHDFAGLEALAQRITDHLKKSGYLLARAYLPRQDVTDGDLEITILAGRLDSKNEPVKIVPGGKLALRIDPERLNAIVSQRRGVADVKDGEACAVEAGEPIEGADPKVAVGSLGERANLVQRQSIFHFPARDRIAGALPERLRAAFSCIRCSRGQESAHRVGDGKDSRPAS